MRDETAAGVDGRAPAPQSATVKQRVSLAGMFAASTTRPFMTSPDRVALLVDHLGPFELALGRDNGTVTGVSAPPPTAPRQSWPRVRHVTGAGCASPTGGHRLVVQPGREALLGSDLPGLQHQRVRPDLLHRHDPLDDLPGRVSRTSAGLT